MEEIRIQDDLYTFVNQAKLNELVIPDDMPVAGSAVNLSIDVEKLMIGEFNTMSAEGSYPNDYLARACTLFKLAKDVKRKGKHGIKLPWGTVNGKFTVSENIADNGGMAVTLDIMSNSENVSFEEYFHNWARVWCQKAKPEYQALLLQVDVHGPSYLRANMPPRNFSEWYTTFNVKKTDGMYLAPSKRVIIW